MNLRHGYILHVSKQQRTKQAAKTFLFFNIPFSWRAIRFISEMYPTKISNIQLHLCIQQLRMYIIMNITRKWCFFKKKLKTVYWVSQNCHFIYKYGTSPRWTTKLSSGVLRCYLDSIIQQKIGTLYSWNVYMHRPITKFSYHSNNHRPKGLFSTRTK